MCRICNWEFREIPFVRVCPSPAGRLNLQQIFTSGVLKIPPANPTGDPNASKSNARCRHGGRGCWPRSAQVTIGQTRRLHRILSDAEKTHAEKTATIGTASLTIG